MLELADEEIKVKEVKINWEAPVDEKPCFIVILENRLPVYNILAPDHFIRNRRAAIGVTYIADGFVDARIWDIDFEQSGPCYRLQSPNGSTHQVIGEDLPVFSHTLNSILELEGDDRLVAIQYSAANGTSIGGSQTLDLFCTIEKLKRIVKEHVGPSTYVFLTSPYTEGAMETATLQAVASRNSEKIMTFPSKRQIPPQVIHERLK